MSILHYFSSDVNKRAQFIFNFIAPLYGKADKSLVNNYSKSIELLNNEVSIKGKKVLDIGSGSGAWATMFLNNEAKSVHGVDFSKKMIEVSKKKHPNITFSIGDGEDLNSFADNSYDLVTASFVLHGVKADRREKILSEMKRISKEHIIIHDFVGRTPLFVRVLEYLEKSDYKNFKSNFCEELESLFSKTKKIPVKDGSGLYIASI